MLIGLIMMNFSCLGGYMIGSYFPISYWLFYPQFSGQAKKLFIFFEFLLFYHLSCISYPYYLHIFYYVK